MGRNKDTQLTEQYLQNRAFDNDFDALVVSPGEHDGESLLRPQSKLVAQKITVSGNYTYIAVAPCGSSQSDAVWRAKRWEITATDKILTWADGNPNFDNVATDLTALSYV